MPNTKRTSQTLPICLALALLTLATFWNVRQNDFINYDDPDYVSENPIVQNGLTLDGIKWAFGFRVSNWHPLTWLSHMLDCQVFNLNPAHHHLVSLLFHTANALLLFLLLQSITGARWRSAFVAALFALHPLRVESVAWISERKDVLSGFFWMLTLWAYARYAEEFKAQASKSKALFYILALLFFALGLMSKSMLVTLPFVLLLLDYWPLKRFPNPKSQIPNPPSARLVKAGPKQPSSPSQLTREKTLSHLLLEKLPFLALTLVACAITIRAQDSADSVRSLTELSLVSRFDNAFISYVRYIGKLLWPENLAVFYPHPKTWPAWQMAASAFVLISITLVVIKSARRLPHLAVGWFWFLGTLIPVIGLVQVGIQSMADRYTYIPMIGLHIAIAWGIYEILARWSPHRVILSAAATASLALCLLLTRDQVARWNTSETLFRHALKVTHDNYTAHENLGIHLARHGHVDEAQQHFLTALDIYPDNPEAHHNLANALMTQGQPEQALPHYLEAVRLKPNYHEAYMNLGMIAVRQGDMQLARNYYSKVVELNPTDVVGHYNLATSLLELGDLPDAIRHYTLALQYQPTHVPSLYQLGAIALKQNRRDDALRHFTEVLRLQPDHAAAQSQLSQLSSQRQ